MFKGLLEGYRSGYDKDFIYKVGEWTIHPDPDTVSKEACGRGLHLCKRLLDVPNLVPDVHDVCWCYYRGTLGEDNSKVRAKAVRLVSVCSWAKLAPLHEDYEKNKAPLHEDYEKNKATLHEDYEKNKATLYDDYEAKLAPLGEDYGKKLATLGKRYERLLRGKFREEAQPLCPKQ
jgi:hypothetical protein